LLKFLFLNIWQGNGSKYSAFIINSIGALSLLFVFTTKMSFSRFNKEKEKYNQSQPNKIAQPPSAISIKLNLKQNCIKLFTKYLSFMLFFGSNSLF